MLKIHSYFKNFKSKTLALFVILELINAILAYALVIYAKLDLSIIYIFLPLILLINFVIGLIIISRVTKPLQIVTQAIAHVSKDPVVTAPPNVTAKKYERSGLKDLVQTVFELAAIPSENVVATEQQKSISQFNLSQIANNFPFGLIIFNKDKNLIYSNSSAPVAVKPDGSYDMTLIFEQNDNFSKWFIDCESGKINDTHIWQRVADKIPGEKDRRIFDVIANYQKNNPSGAEIVVATIDRTALYTPDQEDMDFIAMAAHELRGPITVIRGYLDVFKQELVPKLNAEESELLDRLSVSSERLAGYVNNILNISRYDRNKFQIHMQKERLIDIINNAVPDLYLRAKTQKRQINFLIPKGLPDIAADRSAINEVITNLVDNAIKYSNEGGQVTVGSNLKDGFVEVTVKDEGIGMPDNVVGNLFSRFYRSHRSSGAVGGTGLGLYICKTIIDSHGGSIWVSSKEGRGTTIGFTLPVYDTVAEKLKTGDNLNQDITQRTEGWIKNHAMIRG